MMTPLLARRWFALLVVLLTLPASAQDLMDPTAWKVITSDGVVMSLHRDTATRDGNVIPAIRMDFEFTTGAGYCIMQRPMPMELPENYEFSFGVTGMPRAQSATAPAAPTPAGAVPTPTGAAGFQPAANQGTPINNLEFKLLSRDATGGEDVWWVIKRSFDFTPERQSLTYKKRHFGFAWGPSAGKQPLTKLDAFEIVLSSATGGKGSVWIDGVTFKPLPVMKPYTTTPRVVSCTPGTPDVASDAIDNDFATVWRVPTRAQSSITIDFGQAREIGGVRVAFDPFLDKSHDVTIASATEHSPDVWHTLVRGRTKNLQFVETFTPIESRFLRLTWNAPPATSRELMGLIEFNALPAEAAEDANTLWKKYAENSRAGALPRYLMGRQCAWTAFGPLNDSREALINEDGMVELVRGQCSIEPSIVTRSRLLTWADGKTTQGIDAWPFVTHAHKTGLSLDIRPSWAHGSSGPELRIDYTLRNPGPETIDGDLILQIRPLQVNPPWQFLNLPGGSGRISDIELRQNASHDFARLNDTTSLRWTLPALATVVNEPTRLESPEADGADGIAKYHDARGQLSLHLSRRFSIPPGKSHTFGVAATIRANSKEDEVSPPDSPFTLSRSRLHFTAPPAAQPILDSVAANLAYILINKDGPGFQPGSRSYERSWIRDGSMTAACMLDFGFTDDVKRFIDWYAGFQFESGKVPCVVDARGPDPVPENDSHGQFIYAVAEYVRRTGDTDFAEKHFKSVTKAVAYIEQLRATRKTAEYQTDATRQEPGKPPVPVRAFFGLMPESISHEGYSAKPMHSHWDNFFTLKGLRDAAYLARLLHKDDEEKTWRAAADDLHACIKYSIYATQKAHAITYIPGCVELGDFDATSTAAAISPCAEELYLPEAWTKATFDKYWDFFKRRRDDPTFEWVDYTPYELRIVGAMVRLGHRDRAVEMLDWFMKDQTPPGWHQWAEIVHRDRGAGKWIGDMPHTWVGSDFIRSVRTMFVYEQEQLGGHPDLVLFAGIPEQWLTAPDAEKGVAFTHMHTALGLMDASLKKSGDVYDLTYRVEHTTSRVFLRPPAAWPPQNIEVLDGSIERIGNDYVGTSKTLHIRYR